MARLHGKHQVSTYRRGSKNPAHRTGEKKQSPEGKVQCPVCLRLDVSLTSSGHLREHNAPDKMKCPNRTPPNVQPILPQLSDEELQNSIEDPMQVRVQHPPSRVTDGTPSSVPTGRCHDCDKPVPGSRRLCGACLVKRGNV